MSRGKICHFTSVHPANDTRIFIKECCSLAQAGYETYLVACGIQDSVVNGVQLKGVPQLAEGRIKRVLVTAWRTFQTARSIDADIYHFHDPELLPYGLWLRLQGKKVVYDAHENVPDDILVKEWIPRYLRKLISISVRLLENFISKHLNAVVAATPEIHQRFMKGKCHSVNINNYPLIHELHEATDVPAAKQQSVCFVGGLGQLRGAFEMVEAIGMTDCTLLFAGEFSPASLRDALRQKKGWSQVVELGQISRKEVSQVLARSRAGLVLFHPGPNHTDSQPNKMFEYMSAGLPVIASDFPLWKEIIEGNRCGLCVNPLAPDKIAQAITWMNDNSQQALVMGENGRKAILNKYNWSSELKKLLHLYRELL